MSIKDKYHVQSIKKQLTYDWLLNKHYAHRIPAISYAFGLFNELNILCGIMTLGSGGNINNNDLGRYKLIELNRLVINDGLGKNALSIFVSQCIKFLPKPLALISYADANRNHHGYTYQATNWIYTGLSSTENIFILNNKEIHRKTFYENHGTSSEAALIKIYGKQLEIIKGKPKHRYFYFIGNKKEKQEMKSVLQYEIKSYPKGDNKRYDASYQPKIQTEPF